MALGTERILFLFSQRGADAVSRSVSRLSSEMSKLSGTNAVMDGLTSVLSASGSGVASIAKLGAGATLMAAALTKGAIELANLGGAAIGAQQQFENTAATLGTTSGVLLPQLTQAMGGAVSQMDTMRLANFAVASGLKMTDTQMIRLAEGAKQLAVVYGRTTEDAYSRIIQASVKRERRLLDELGIVIRASDIYEKYAAAHGKLASDLTVEEERAAFFAATLDAVNEKMGQFAGVNFAAATAGNRMGAMIEDFSAALGKMFIESGAAEKMSKSLAMALDFIFSKIEGADGGAAFFDGIANGFAAVLKISIDFLSVIVAIVPYLEKIAKLVEGFTVGAAGGGAIGSFFGPVGTAIGAGLGGLAGGAYNLAFGDSLAEKTGNAVGPRFDAMEGELTKFQQYLSNRMNSETPSYIPLPP